MHRFLKLILAAVVINISASTIADAEDQVIIQPKLEQSQTSTGISVELAAAKMKDAVKKCDKPAYDVAKREYEAAGGAGAYFKPLFYLKNAQILDLMESNGMLYPAFCDPVYVNTGQGFTVAASGRDGKIKLPPIHFFRTEMGGNVITHGLFRPRQESQDFSGSEFQIVIPNALPPLPEISQETWDAFFGFSRASASTDTSIDILSANNYQLGILSPEGPSGFLGGGILINSGFGDVTGLRFKNSYSEEFYRLGVQNTFTTNTATGALIITPRIGAFYGAVHDSSRLFGTTNGNTLDFNYHNEIETDRLGVEAGLEIRLKLPSGVGAYIDGDARFIHDDAHGESRFAVDGFIPEVWQGSKSQYGFGGVIGAGFFVENENVSGRIGVEYETWQIPNLSIPGSREAFLTFNDRESVTARMELTVLLTPQLVNPDQ